MNYVLGLSYLQISRVILELTFLHRPFAERDFNHKMEDIRRMSIPFSRRFFLRI